MTDPPPKRRRRRWLRRAVWFAAACLVLLAALYVYATRPARLRAHVLRALASLPADHVAVGQVTFSPWGELQLTGIELTFADQRGPAESPPGADRRSRLRVARARIQCDLPALLAGRVRPRELALHSAELRVVCASATEGAGADPESDGNRRRWRLPTFTRSVPPRITIDRADVQLLVSDERGLRLRRRWVMSGLGKPTETGYALRLDPTEREAGPLAELHWDQRSGDIEITADWLHVETAALFLPDAPASTFAECDLQGRVRVEHAMFRAPPTELSVVDEDSAAAGLSLRTAELRLADLRCALPIEEADGEGVAWAASKRFLQVSEGEASLHWDHTDAAEAGLLTMRATARLNGAPAKLSLTMQPTAQGSLPHGMDDIVSAELSVTDLEFPTFERHPAFVTSRRLPRGLRNFFNDFRPHGPINLWWHTERKRSEFGEAVSPGGRLPVEGEVELLAVRCRYHKFPYAFDDVRGRVRISQAGVFLEGITARHGSCRVRADGIVNHTGHGAGFNLVFHGTNIPLDADLFAAVPAKHQRLWRQTAPLGACDARVTVRREEPLPSGDDSPTDVRVDARLLGGSLLVRPGQRLQTADGSLTITNEVLAIHDLHGYLDGAAVRLDGTLGVNGDQSLTDLRLEATDVQIEWGDPPGTARSHTDIQFMGKWRADVWGRIHGDATGTTANHYIVRLKDGVLTGTDPDQHWERCEGWIRVADNLRDIMTFQARQGDTSLQVSGTLTAAPGSSGSTPLVLGITDARMELIVPQFIPRRWSDVTEALGLAGPGAVTVRLQPDESSALAAGRVALVDLSAQRMKPAPLPLDLRDVRARADVTADGMVLHEARAAHGEEGEIHASARLEWQNGNPRGKFSLHAEHVDISSELIDALPKAAAGLLHRLTPRGRLRADFDHVQVSGDETGLTWEFAGRLSVAAGRLDLGLPLRDFDGELDGTCTIQPDGDAELAGTFSIDQGRLAGRPIEAWQGQLRHDTGDRWVRLEDLHGRLCGGDALGTVRIDPDSSAYELSLSLQNVHFGQLLPPQQSEQKPLRRGRVEGHLSLRGIADDASSRTGGGNLRIRGASFLQTPVLAQVAEANRQARRELDDALDLMELRFDWQGSQLKLTRVDIQSRDLRLVGQGIWNMDTDALDLTLLGAHPRHWPRVAVLTDLLEAAGQELLQYRVRGTAAAPQVTVEPLHKLNEALRVLLEGNAELRIKN